MKFSSIQVLVAAALCGALASQPDDFQREGDAKKRIPKDALEGKMAPALEVDGWMNTQGNALHLQELRGKVILLKFWGVW